MLSDGLGRSFFAQGSNPAPRENETWKGDPLLKENARNEIEGAGEWFRRHRLQLVPSTLEHERHNDAPDGNQ